MLSGKWVTEQDFASINIFIGTIMQMIMHRIHKTGFSFILNKMK